MCWLIWWLVNKEEKIEREKEDKAQRKRGLGQGSGNGRSAEMCGCVYEWVFAGPQ